MNDQKMLKDATLEELWDELARRQIRQYRDMTCEEDEDEGPMSTEDAVECVFDDAKSFRNELFDYFYAGMLRVKDEDEFKS